MLEAIFRRKRPRRAGKPLWNVSNRWT